MFGIIQKIIRGFRRRNYKDMAPEDIFMDSKNLPAFDVYQLEGRLEKPISNNVFFIFSAICILLALVFIGKLWSLQITHGFEYKERSENNMLRESVIVAPRGGVFSRNGKPLIWNEISTTSDAFPLRRYVQASGFGNLLGFIKYPAKDSKGFYYEEDFTPKDGAELYFNEILAGRNGMRLTEVSVNNEIISENIVEPPLVGSDLVLSIDYGVQKDLYENIKNLAQDVNFKGGGGVIMDLENGQILAMATYPEYDSNILTQGENTSAINEYLKNPQNPFLNRAISGLYTPGSIVKPFLAFGALEEGIINPNKEIVSTGKLVVPNPYNPDNPTIFKDWKAHGAVDMRHAIAVSSDVYFYQIGGGFGDQKGLGVAKIKMYLEKFGFTKKTGLDNSKEETGIIPDPIWKAKVFPDDPWRIGDTYNTSIGQYGMKITPIQAVRATAALANGGYLVEPTLEFLGTTTKRLGAKIEGKPENMKVAIEGMRLSAVEGTAKGLSNPNVTIAAKTGTAELGARKEFVNSWVIGFWPYENPKYAFAVVMERGPVANLVGATSVMRKTIDWMAVNTPEYFKNENNN